MLPTSFSLWLYCGEPARTPSRISFALLLVDAPHLILSAVVLQRACSHSLAHFLRATPGQCSPPRSLCSCTAESLLVLLLVLTFLALFPRTPLGRWLLTGSLCGYTARACSCSPSCSSIFTLLLALLPRTPPGDTCTCEAYIYIICVRQSLFTSCFPPLPIHLSLHHRLTAHIPCTRHHRCASLRPPCTFHALIGLDGPSCQDMEEGL